MSAFHNGHFGIQINRLDAEYWVERPFCGAKKKGKEKGMLAR